ncbi:MAG: ribosome recycling factor [Candidatus Doudnabacteria bacterium]|nr:ribosome recycling factor [Candidatus Doudnabacteria bacterium]
MDLIKQKKPEFEKAVDHLRSELSTLRTGRAQSALVENLLVDYYGVKTPLLQIAQITVPEPRSITIQPYDKSSLGAIEKAIQTSNLGINPGNEGSLIRLTIPPMNEERRKDLVKTVSQMSEKTRVAIRNIREDIWKEIQKSEKDGKISEDDRQSAKEELQKIVDEFNEEIKKITEAKEKEVLVI